MPKYKVGDDVFICRTDAIGFSVKYHKVMEVRILKKFTRYSVNQERFWPRRTDWSDYLEGELFTEEEAKEQFNQWLRQDAKV